MPYAKTGNPWRGWQEEQLNNTGSNAINIITLGKVLTIEQPGKYWKCKQLNTTLGKENKMKKPQTRPVSIMSEHLP